MDHELKVLRDVTFRPVLDAILGLQVREPNLVDGKKVQANAFQPLLRLAQGTDTSTLFDSFPPEKNGMANKRWVAS
jgi:hypothetical protein